MGHNVCSHLPLLSAQISGRASHTQIHTGDAGKFYTSAGKVKVWGCAGNVCVVPCKLSVFPRFLQFTSPILTKGHGTTKNQALQKCAQVRKQWDGCKVVP